MLRSPACAPPNEKPPHGARTTARGISQHRAVLLDRAEDIAERHAGIDVTGATEYVDSAPDPLLHILTDVAVPLQSLNAAFRDVNFVGHRLRRSSPNCSRYHHRRCDANNAMNGIDFRVQEYRRDRGQWSGVGPIDGWRAATGLHSSSGIVPSPDRSIYGVRRPPRGRPTLWTCGLGTGSSES